MSIGKETSKVRRIPQQRIGRSQLSTRVNKINQLMLANSNKKGFKVEETKKGWTLKAVSFRSIHKPDAPSTPLLEHVPTRQIGAFLNGVELVLTGKTVAIAKGQKKAVTKAPEPTNQVKPLPKELSVLIKEEVRQAVSSIIAQQPVISSASDSKPNKLRKVSKKEPKSNPTVIQ